MSYICGSKILILDKTGINKKAMIEAMQKHRSIVSLALRAANIPHSTYYAWLQNDAEFKKEIDNLQEYQIDFVEGKLLERIEGVNLGEVNQETGEIDVYKTAPSDTAIIFYLKTKGKKRGYSEKDDADNDKSIININFISEPFTPPSE